jgi:RNA polymerase sigma-70 factor, ECF subfamily
MSSTETTPELRRLDDAALVLRLIAGQQNALDVIMERHRAMVYSVVRRIIGDKAEAEDTAQDVFLEVLETRSFDSNSGTVKGWLRTLARRRALDRRKHLDRRGFYSLMSLDDDDCPQPTTAEDQERSRGEELIKRLRPREKEVIVLKYLGGYSNPEIATITRQSVRMVRYALSEARRKLKSGA